MKLGPNQQKLVNVLRSGKYQQCTGALSRNGCFCALGVACKVAEKGGVELEYYGDGELKGSDLLYQSDVRRFFDFLDHTGGYIDEYDIVHLNDIEELTFKQLANVIENNPHEFFHESK